MLDVLQNFEQTATQFRATVLLVPGVAALLVGLFIWLGGLGLRRLLIALVGAVVGGMCGLFVIGRSLILTVVCTCLGALFAIILQRIIIALLAAALVAILAFAILGKPYLLTAGQGRPLSPPAAQNGPRLSVSESIEKTKAYALECASIARRAGAAMPIRNWAIIAVLTLASAAVAFVFWRLFSALCCATLGTMLIFGGMILLLVWKGSAPITGLSSRGTFYGGVFVAMAAFGTLEQLLLCRREKKPAKESKTDKQPQDAERTKHSWRTS